MDHGQRATFVVALGVLLTACAREVPPTQTAQPANVRAAVAPAPVAPRPAVAPRADALHVAAVHALLTNLIDFETDTPRFADPQLSVVCAERKGVRLHGRPIAPGDPVPAGSFVLEWSLDGACPLGFNGQQLFDALQMLVLRDYEQGLVPLVVVQP